MSPQRTVAVHARILTEEMIRLIQKEAPTAVLQLLIGSAGASHVLLGSDYPFDMSYFDGVRQVRSLSISESDQALILGESASALLRMTSATRHAWGRVSD
jgi:predicted TIM-barrel fold metal-dependent hydrolase